MSGAINWQVYATYAAPVITLLLGIAINRTIEKRPRLVSFLSHASGVRFRPPVGEPFAVNTHAVVVRNVGRKTATNVRLGHHELPENFTVFPPIEHNVLQLDGTAKEIIFPSLVPGEQVFVTYLYFGPLTFNGVNSYIKSDEGHARIINVLPSPQRSKWQRYALNALVVVGAVTVLYALASIGAWAWAKAFGP